MSNMPIALMEDAPPYLDFSQVAKEDRTASIEAGYKQYVDSEIVTITPMGDNKTQVIKQVSEWLSHLKERHHHKMVSDNYLRFCEQSYKAWKENRAAPINGTPIDQWPQASPAEIEVIRNANIRSIEDLANCNDEALGEIGMGARSLKHKAQLYLENAKNHGAVSEKMNAMEVELETEKEENKRLSDRLAALEAKLGDQPVIDTSNKKANRK